MRRTLTASIAFLLAVGCLSGCNPGSTESDPEGSAPSSQLDPPSDDASTSDQLTGAPERMTCWLAPKRAFAHDFWFDNLSRQVACTDPHTSETVSVVELDEPTIGNAEQQGDWCRDSVLSYLDISPEHWVPWTAILYLPSKEQVADGASWVRCDAGLSGDRSGSTMRAVEFPHEDAAYEHNEELRACLDQDPHVVDQPFLDCADPHAFESTSQLASLDRLNAYPSAAMRRKAASQCRTGLPPEQSSSEFKVTAVWDSKEGFSGGSLFGVCFVHRADGAPLGRPSGR